MLVRAVKRAKTHMQTVEMTIVDHFCGKPGVKRSMCESFAEGQTLMS